MRVGGGSCPGLLPPDLSAGKKCIHANLSDMAKAGAFSGFLCLCSTIQGACVHAKSLQSCPTLGRFGPEPARLLCPWDSAGMNIGVGCRVLLRGSFQPRDQPQSLKSPALAGRFFTTRATWKSHQSRVQLANRRQFRNFKELT